MWADQPPKLWLPPKPAIIRSAADLLRPSSIIVPPPFFKRAAALGTTATYTAGASSAASAGPYNFPSLAVGAAFAGRYVVLVVHFDSSNSVTAVTIAGLTPTKLLSQLGSLNKHEVYIVALPSGTTATVVVTLGTSNACSVDLWAISGLQSTTPVDTTAVNTAVQNYSNTDIAAPAGSCVIAARSLASGNPTYTWGGLTEDRDASVTTNFTVTAAHGNFASAQSPVTISCNSTAAGGRGSFVAICLK